MLTNEAYLNMTTSQHNNKRYVLHTLGIHISLRLHYCQHHAGSIDGQPSAGKDDSLGDGVALYAHCRNSFIRLLRTEHPQDDVHITAVARPIIEAIDAGVCGATPIDVAR